jgi:hypothetical protein
MLKNQARDGIPCREILAQRIADFHNTNVS